jgi:hypothetical protein
MVKRRKMLLGLGSLAAGGAAAMGTGAFTSTEANRSMYISRADDSQAFLQLTACTGPNGDFVYDYGDDLEVDISGDDWTGVTGEGVNSMAITQFDCVFKIANQGTQEVEVAIDDSNISMPDRLTFYQGSDPSSDLESWGNVTLGIGDAVHVGMEVDTTEMYSDSGGGVEQIIGNTGNVRIKAEATSDDSGT